MLPGERLRPRFAGGACGRDGHLLLRREFHRRDDGIDRIDGLLRGVEAECQDVAAVGQLRCGGGIGGVHRQGARDGFGEGQRDLRNLFAEVIRRNADFQHVDLVIELEFHHLAVVALLQGRAFDRSRDHDVAVAAERAILLGGNPVAGLQPLGRDGFGRYGIVDVGVLRHLRDGGREFGRIVLRVVVPELENLPVDRRLRLGVDGPEHDPVVVGPPDRFAVFVQFGAGLRPGPNTDLRARAYRNFDGTCCGFRVCCGSLGA